MIKRSRNQNEPADAEQSCDRELILRFADHGDQVAFRELVARHGPLVFRVCRAILRHHQDAEDAFQATFLVLAQKAGRVRWHDSLANWLYGTAQRIALKASARLQREQAKPMDDEPHATDVFDELAAYDAQRALHEELSRLPEPLRAPLILCYLEGKSQNQAAKDLAVTPATINGRLQRGRLRLRVQLARRGIGLAVPAAAVGGTLSIQPAGAATFTSSPLAIPPEPLVNATVQAATEFTSGLASSGAASAQAWTLAKGELAMFTSTTAVKLTTATGALLAVLGISWLLLSSDAAADGPEPLLSIETQLVAEPVGAQPPPTSFSAEDLANDPAADSDTYSFEQQSVLLVGSRKSNVIMAFSAHTGRWHRQPIEPAAGEQVVPLLLNDFAVFQAGNRVYGFSGIDGTWDSFEVPEDFRAEPVMRRDFATVQVGDIWYAFSGIAPVSQWVAMNLDEGVDEPERGDE